MLKSKSKRKQPRDQNTLNTERLEQRAMFSVSPAEPVVALDVGPVNQAGDNGCSIVHPAFRTGSQAGPRGTSFMTGDDGRMIVHPAFDGGGDGIRIVHPAFDGDGDGIRIVHPAFDGDATFVGETLVGRESERPEPLDLPSREMLDVQLNDYLHNMHHIDTALMAQSITEAMVQDVYMDMVLGSMVNADDGVTATDVAGEVAQTAVEEVAGWSLGGWLGGLFGTTTTAAQGAETGAKGVSNVCKYLKKLADRLSEVEGSEDAVETCEDKAGNGDDGNEEKGDEEDVDDCFPPIIIEEIYGNLGREEIHSNYVGHENLASVVRVQEMIPRHNHLTHTVANNYSYANNYARNQAFHNWH